MGAREGKGRTKMGLRKSHTCNYMPLPIHLTHLK